MSDERQWQLVTSEWGVGDRVIDVSVAVRRADDHVGIALCMDGDEQQCTVHLDARRARILARKLLAAADGGMTDPWPVADRRCTGGAA